VSNLSKQNCSACEEGAPLVSKQQAKEFLAALDNWSIDNSNIDKLIKQYNFKNYKQASEFLNLIVELAERENHHPKITLEWGQVSLEWWSHKIKGLHMNDFICASKSDTIFNNAYK
jgi:4a-hydroxytetrahydrobiopterin dehydratase